MSAELIPFPIMRQPYFRHLITIATDEILPLVGNAGMRNADEFLIARHVQRVADKLTWRGFAPKHIAPNVIDFENALRAEIARRCKTRKRQ